MDDKLINTFRDKVADGFWVYNHYHNFEGCNKWSIICSAMDWITVSVPQIDPSKLSKGNDNQASALMMQFINAIDVMWESIQQLHRVFFNTSGIPFKDERSCFSDKVIDKPDNEYFKTIRACFSAHPVNINEAFSGKPSTSSAKERWFASWSGGTFSKKDFAVFLSSNDPKKEPILFNISFSELMAFAEQRYSYLNDIMRQIDILKLADTERLKNTPIEKSDDPLMQISILEKENQLRCNSDYLNYALQKIKIIYKTTITSQSNVPIVTTYREAVYPLISEIYDSLQTISGDELEHEGLTETPCDFSMHYLFSKLCEFVFGDGSPVPISGESFQKELGDAIDLRTYSGYDELYVLILAGCYAKKGLSK